MELEKTVGMFVAGADTYAGEAYRNYVSQFKTHATTVFKYMQTQHPEWVIDPGILAIVAEYQKHGNLRTPDGITIPAGLPSTGANTEHLHIWVDLARRMDVWYGINLNQDYVLDDLSIRQAYVFMKWLLETNGEMFGAGLAWPAYLSQDPVALQSFLNEDPVTLSLGEWLASEFGTAGVVSGLSEAASEDLYSAIISVFGGISSYKLGGDLTDTVLDTAYRAWRTAGTDLLDVTGWSLYLGDINDMLATYGVEEHLNNQLTARLLAVVWALAKNGVSSTLTTDGSWYFDMVAAYCYLLPTVQTSVLPVRDWEFTDSLANGRAYRVSNMVPDPYYAIFLQLATMFVREREADRFAVLIDSESEAVRVLPPAYDYLLECCRVFVPLDIDTLVPYSTAMYDSSVPYIGTALVASSDMSKLFGKTLVSLIGYYASFVGPGAVSGDDVSMDEYRLSPELRDEMYNRVNASLDWSRMVSWFASKGDNLEDITLATYLTGARVLLQYLLEISPDITELYQMGDATPMEENTMIAIEVAAGNDRVINTLASMLDTASEDLRKLLSGASALTPARALSTWKLGGYDAGYYALKDHHHPEYLRLDESLSNADLMYWFNTSNFVTITPVVETEEALEFDVTASVNPADAWKLFSADGWAGSGGSDITIDFLTDRYVRRYSITVVGTGLSTADLYGSSDGLTWTHLDTRDWTGTGQFYVVNPGLYRYYRVSLSGVSYTVRLDMEEYSGIPEQIGASDLALTGHSHEDEYYGVDDTVEDSLYLIDEATAMRNTPVTAYGTFAYDTRSYRSYEIGEAVFTKDSLALTTHTHPEYLQQGETAYSAEAFYDGVNFYYADDFSNYEHEHESPGTYDPLMPEMLDNDTPAPYAVTASYNSSNAWRVFSSAPADVWEIDLTDGDVTLDIDIGEPRKLNRYLLAAVHNYEPYEWELCGSVDTDEWTLLDENSHTPWGEGETLEIGLDVSAKYRYYQLKLITAVRGDNIIRLSTLQVYAPRFTYLRVGDPARVAIRVGGKTWRDFALKSHNHDDRYYTAGEMESVFMKRSSLPVDGPVDVARAVGGFKVKTGELTVPAGGTATVSVPAPVACVLTLMGTSVGTSRPRTTLTPEGVQFTEVTGGTSCTVSYMILYTG